MQYCLLCWQIKCKVWLPTYLKPHSFIRQICDKVWKNRFMISTGLISFELCIMLRVCIDCIWYVESKFAIKLWWHRKRSFPVSTWTLEKVFSYVQTKKWDVHMSRWKGLEFSFRFFINKFSFPIWECGFPYLPDT